MLRLGLLGHGFIGKAHAAAFSALDDAEVVAVATATSTVDGPVRHYTDPHELLASDDVDAVVIALPTDLHAEFAVAALRQGKDVLIEKPVGLTVEDAELIADAEADGGVAMVAHVLRHTPEYAAAAQTITSGELGDLIGVHSHRMSSPPRWSGWLAQPARSGGALLDLLVHDFDLMNWLLGPPDAVVASGRQGEHGGWDHVEVGLRYAAHPAVVHVHGSQLMPEGFPFTAGLHVVGSDGAVELSNRHDGAQIDGAAHAALIEYSGDGSRIDHVVPGGDPFATQARAFTRAVRDRKVPAGLRVSDGADAVRIALAAHRSLVTGEEVVLAHR